MIPKPIYLQRAVRLTSRISVCVLSLAREEYNQRRHRRERAISALESDQIQSMPPSSTPCAAVRGFGLCTWFGFFQIISFDIIPSVNHRSKLTSMRSCSSSRATGVESSTHRAKLTAATIELSGSPKRRPFCREHERGLVASSSKRRICQFCKLKERI